MQFLTRARWAALVMVVIGLMWTPAQAQNNIAYQAPVVGYVGADGNVYVNSLNATSAATPLTGDALGRREFIGFSSQVVYSHLKWSPDGTSLAFMRFGRNVGEPTGAIYVANSGQSPVSIVSAASGDFGFVWSPTGAEIGYVLRSDTSTDGGLTYSYTFLAVPRTGGQPRVVNTFQMQYFGEGFPNPDISDDLLIGESFPANNGAAMAWLDSGIVHPTNPISNAGLALSDFSGQERWRIDNLSNAVISPDRRYAVGRQYPQNGDPNVQTLNVVVVDLNTGLTTLVATAPFVDSVGWTQDSARVLYGSATKLNPIVLDMTKPSVSSTFGDFPRESANYMANLMSVPITGGTSTPVLSYPGRGFASISPIDATRIVFSLVESSFAAVSAANVGASAEQLFTVRPKVLVGSLTLGSSQPSLLSVEARRPAVSSAAVFIGITAPISQATEPVSCPGTLPSRMVVGKQGRVTPGEPNNLNTQPSPPSRDPNSKRLALIPAGGVFTVITGPVCGFGYTWWQVNYNGTVGWTAESGDGVYWLEPIG